METVSFATARRGVSHDALDAAKSYLNRGYGYQTTARITGLNEMTLREALGPLRAKPAPEPKPPAPPRLQPLARAAEAVADSSPEECAQIAAIAIATIHERSGLNTARLTVANIMNSIPSLIPAEVAPVHRNSAREVAEYVAALHGLSFDDLASPRRSRPYARARQVAMHAIHSLCPHMSYPAIGRLLGNRDHTTILHGVQKIEDLVQIDPEIAGRVAKVFEAFTPSKAA